MTRKLLLAFIIIFGLYYVFFIEIISQPLVMVFKLLPMMLIILLAILTKAENIIPYKTLIILALIFCAFGDYTLQWFILGLSCFLVGHLFYIRAFLSEKGTTAPRWIIILLAIYGLSMMIWIGSSLIEENKIILAIAVSAYMIVILVMGSTSFRTGSKVAVSGALLFIISDSVLAINKFMFSVDYSHQIIMLTYYSAQILMALSIPKYSAIRSKVIQYKH
ncbi:lysoplasmalogenase [Ureibacillus sp. GCM10028918]|uniref:lysoplasmalogenase n=1 Tax=Ureibacillus sp. GCM10028918 TaxID=3273429 RepID=UPI00360D51C3